MERAGAEDMPEDAERKGLGTPATRAAILEKLVQMGFIQRKGKQLIPTKDGINLAVVLPEALTSPQLTAEWESRLTEIAKGQADPDEFMAGIEAMTRELVETYSCISEDMNMLMVDFQNRKREFGLLEAVGATQKQLKAMLSREIGIYLGGSLTVSLVLGTIISIIACQRLEAVNHCITLNLPWLFLIALIAAMVVIYMIFTAYAKAELRKTGILSAIREE